MPQLLEKYSSILNADTKGPAAEETNTEAAKVPERNKDISRRKF